jgi:hypothetical protein
MTTPNAYRQFGQTLAFAERTLTTVLRRHLAQRAVAPETWYALKLIAVGGPRLSREALTSDLEGSATLNPDSVRELLAQLQVEGLIQGDTEVDFTIEGQHLFSDLQEYVSRATAELLGEFELDDIDTTVRTLQAITERAAKGLSMPAYPLAE